MIEPRQSIRRRVGNWIGGAPDGSPTMYEFLDHVVGGECVGCLENLTGVLVKGSERAYHLAKAEREREEAEARATFKAAHARTGARYGGGYSRPSREATA